MVTGLRQHTHPSSISKCSWHMKFSTCTRAIWPAWPMPANVSGCGTGSEYRTSSSPAAFVAAAACEPYCESSCDCDIGCGAGAEPCKGAARCEGAAPCARVWLLPRMFLPLFLPPPCFCRNRVGDCASGSMSGSAAAAAAWKAVPEESGELPDGPGGWAADGSAAPPANGKAERHLSHSVQNCCLQTTPHTLGANCSHCPAETRAVKGWSVIPQSEWATKSLL